MPLKRRCRGEVIKDASVVKFEFYCLPSKHIIIGINLVVSDLCRRFSIRGKI